ncbi:MAG: T9SS type A sorting domain-containing protein [Bacteroidales bacterium]|nr:T9SS type A sorting domain-containing protein [Bacteroidales bacterium]
MFLIDNLHDVIGTYSVPLVMRITYNNNNGLTYASGTYITSFSGNNFLGTIGIDALADEIVVNESNNDIGVVSIDGGSTRIFDHSLSFVSNKNLGSRICYGSLAESLNKSLWLNSLSYSSFGTATLIDHNTGEYHNFTIGAWLNSLAYNEENMKFFVGFNHDYLGRGVSVIDAENNTLITTFNDLHPVGIYSSGDYAYIGSNNKIHIINANNLNVNTLEPSGNYRVKHFVEDEENVYALAYNTSLPSGNKVIAIRKSDHTVIAEVPVDQWAYDICIDTDRGKIYVISYQSNNINIINTNDFSSTDWLFAGQFYPNEIEFCSRDNLLFCRGKDVNYNESVILVLDCSDNSQKGVLNYSGMNMKYNESNNCLYVQGYVRNNNTSELYCRVIHCSTLEIIDDIYLHQNAEGYIFSFLEAGDILYNTTTNEIYIPNQGLSNFSIIQCSDDILPLQEDRDGWTWLSFPRLNRTGNQGVPVDDVLGNDAGGNSLILPGDYFDGDFKTRPQNSEFMDYAEFNYDNDVWVPDQNDPLNEVKSTYGYKIYLDPDQEYVRLQGSMLDHDHPDAYIELHEDYEDNWTGYWLPERQDPFDAIPQWVLDELTSFKSQSWACAKYWGDGIPEPYWLCATQKDDIMLSYGDMVVMETGTDLTFQWNRYGSGNNDDGRSAPEQYQYTEQSDYTSLFVELDTTENPQEMGAFVGDSCVGATKVLENDTLVLIPAYTDGLSGDITFQEYYGTKATSAKRDDYYVNTFISGKWEKRNIHTKENNDFYLISLKGKKNNVHIPQEISFGLSCFPNPVSATCRISYTLPSEQHVRLEVCDIFGNTVAVIRDGLNKSGDYELTWKAVYSSGQKLPAGVYIIQLKVNGRTEKTKIVIGG